MKRYHTILSLLLTCALVACAQTNKQPENKEEKVGGLPSPPKHWHAKIKSIPITENLARANWLENLADKNLLPWVEKTLKYNTDLKTISARMLSAHAAARQISGNSLPNISAQYEYSGYKKTGATRYVPKHQAGFLASWELDIWGKLDQEKQASLLDYTASKADLEAARLAIVSALARTWYQAIGASMLFDQQKEQSIIAEKLLLIVQSNFEQGLVSALDVHAARSVLASDQLKTLNRKSAAKQNRIQVQLLAGQYPDGKITLPASLPETLPAIPAGTPSTLLARRLDVQAALARLNAATNRVNLAKNFRWPSFKLTGQYGLLGESFPSKIDLANWLWSWAAQITAPLYSGGKIQGAIDQSLAKKEQAKAEYVKTALNAFGDVESALINEQNLQQRLDAATLAKDSAHSAYALSEGQYRSGLIQVGQMLEFKRRHNEAEIALTELQVEIMLNRIALHNALGGTIGVANKTKDSLVSSK